MEEKIEKVIWCKCGHYWLSQAAMKRHKKYKKNKHNISNSGQETSDEESAIEELEHGTEEQNNNNQMLIFNIFKSPFTEGEIWYL